MAIARIDSYRTLAFGAITVGFVPVGAALTHTWRAFRVVNTTDGNITISFDGINDNLFIPASSFVLYDLSANSSTISSEDGLVLSKGTQFYVKQATAPTLGAIYIEGFYALGE